MTTTTSLNINKGMSDEEDIFLALTLRDALLYGKPENRYQISFEFGITVKLKRDATVDKLIATPALIVTSKSPGDLVITTYQNKVLATARIFQKPGYCSMYFKCWSQTREHQKEFERLVKNIFAEDVTKGIVCGIQWAFQTTKGLQTVYIEETFDDVVHDEAYPSIIAEYGSIEKFITAYLESDEAILILQGPAGTGKSRLIRKVLALLASSFSIEETAIIKDDRRSVYFDDMPSAHDTGLAPSLALYTGDMKVIESDEIFARFLTSEERVFIVEDADHALQPRSNGNQDLHRFLTVSDGIVKSIGRKVIFTTNLANIGDLDDALIRPGRCFARHTLGLMSKENAEILMRKICPDEQKIASSLATLYSDKKEKSLAEIYKSIKGE